MKRREFVASVLAAGVVAPAVAQDDREHGHGRGHEGVDGPLANASVSFGAWPSDPPLDRMNLPPVGPPPNAHVLLPRIATIKAGGSVNFVVAGLHQIAVYRPGTQPSDIVATMTQLIPGAPPPPLAPPIINDPHNRIYRGFIAWPPVVDRVEVVQFSNKGLHLVICTVLPHFNDKMWGWVKVV